MGDQVAAGGLTEVFFTAGDKFCIQGLSGFLYGRFASRVATGGKKGYFPILEMDSALRALLWSHIVKLNHTSVTLCTQSTSSLG